MERKRGVHYGENTHDKLGKDSKISKKRTNTLEDKMEVTTQIHIKLKSM